MNNYIHMCKFITILLTVLVFISCKTSDDVITGRKIQKRKYTSGWHVDQSDAKKHNGTITAQPKNEISTSRQSPDNIFSESDSSIQSTQASSDHVSNQQFVVTETQEKKDQPSKPILKALSTIITTAPSSGVFSTTVDHHAFAEKKKKRKEKLEPLTLWGRNLIAIASWLINWPVHLPYVAIPLIAIGMIMLIVSLTKLKKTKKRNKRLCYIGLAGGVILIILALVF